MDQLIIKDLVIFGHHGVYQEEKKLGQKFIVDLIIDLDLGDACETDHLEHALNYAQLSHELTMVFQRENYDLIERAAQVLCSYVLEHYPSVKQVDLTLKKPWAPVLLELEYPAVRIIRGRHDAYIAVGSNLGDKKANIEQALELIKQSGHTKVLRQSTLIETDPVGYDDQNPFLNGVLMVSTTLSPKNLMQWLLSIEADLKRERLVKWGPRTIDLDIIYFDDLVTDDMAIVLPHPRMHERAFVLEPLAEIAPYAVHPLYKKRTVELLDALRNKIAQTSQICAE
jgi:dihydroneopterin aldolase/2-amino-4-hydroxy-6-hydroxymethyldihydropteridine diphosphokinase